jgi:hypothetical protein
MSDRRDELAMRLAQLQAHRGPVQEARRKLIARTREQLDSMEGTIHTIEQHLEAGGAGGIYGHRRLRTLLKERERLQHILAMDEARGGR